MIKNGFDHHPHPLMIINEQKWFWSSSSPAGLLWPSKWQTTATTAWQSCFWVSCRLTIPDHWRHNDTSIRCIILLVKCPALWYFSSMGSRQLHFAYCCCCCCLQNKDKDFFNPSFWYDISNYQNYDHNVDGDGDDDDRVMIFEVHGFVVEFKTLIMIVMIINIRFRPIEHILSTFKIFPIWNKL